MLRALVMLGAVAVSQPAWAAMPGVTSEAIVFEGHPIIRMHAVEAGPAGKTTVDTFVFAQANPALARINAALQADLPNGRGPNRSLIACRVGLWQETITIAPTAMVGHWLTTTRRVGGHCSGIAGADTEENPVIRVWDTQTGRQMDPWRWLQPQYFTRVPGGTVNVGQELREAITRVWDSNDSRCGDIPDGNTAWTLYPARNGLVFAPAGMPSASMVCIRDAVVSYETVGRWLSGEGSAALPAIFERK